MIQPTHQKILNCLAEVSELSEDVRFGQMIDFLEFLAQDATGRSLAEIEDEELLKAIDQHRLDLRKRVPRDQSALPKVKARR